MKKILVICGLFAVMLSCNNAPETTSKAGDSAVEGADHTMSAEKMDTAKVINDSIPQGTADTLKAK